MRGKIASSWLGKRAMSMIADLTQYVADVGRAMQHTCSSPRLAEARAACGATIVHFMQKHVTCCAGRCSEIPWDGDEDVSWPISKFLVWPLGG